MEQNLNLATAEELFGAESVLATQCEGAISGVESLGSIYQLATGVVGVLCIFIFVHFSELFRYLILSSVSNRAKRSDIHIYSAEVKNIEIVTSIIGTILLALLVMRLSVIEGLHTMFAPIHNLSIWGIGGCALAAIVATMVGERLMLYIVGFVSGRGDVCIEIWNVKQLHFSLAIIVIAPMLIFALLTDGIATHIALILSVAVCSILSIFFLKETFSFFRAQRFSIFHWILYLCALEFFPLSLLLAPIVR